MSKEIRTSQIDMIMEHLEKHGSITMIEALQEYGIGRLQARICDLRKLGVPIVTSFEEKINKYGRTTRYARYSLNGNNEDLQISRN